MTPVKIAIPNKGRLSADALDLLKKAGFAIEDAQDRKLYAKVSNGDIAVIFVRADDIPEFVQDGVVDLGITGSDIVEEERKKVKTLLDLGFGRCKLVVAAPQKSKIKKLSDVEDDTAVASSFPSITKRYFAENGKRVRIVELAGAVEVSPQLGLADIIVDLTSSGSTLKVNRMDIIATILESSAILIGNRESVSAKKERIEDIVAAMRSVLDAEGKRYIMANVPKTRLDEAKTILPGISGPTVLDIVGREGIVAVHAVVDDSEIYKIINKLKALGATGILVMNVDRMIL